MPNYFGLLFLTNEALIVAIMMLLSSIILWYVSWEVAIPFDLTVSSVFNATIACYHSVSRGTLSFMTLFVKSFAQQYSLPFATKNVRNVKIRNFLR